MNNFKLNLFIIIYFFSNGLVANPENSKIDSLKLIVSKSTKDSVLVNNYLLLSDYLFDLNTKESQNYANKAHHTSKQIKYALGKADALYQLGKLDLKLGKLHLGIDHIKQSLIIYENLNNKNKLARSFSEMGNVYTEIGDMVKAIENHQKAIKLFTEMSNNNGIAMAYSDLGRTHYFQRNYSTALRYYKKAKVLFDREDDKKSTAELYNRISIVFRELDELDKSLEYDYLALMTQEKLRDKQGIANSNYNIGKTSILQGEIQRAKGYIEYAQKLYIELQDKLGISKCYLLSAQILISENNLTAAKTTLTQSIFLAKERGELKELSQAYQLLSDIYLKENKFDSAYVFLNLHSSLKDTLFSKEKSKQFSEMEVRYQSQSKDEIISKANKEKEKSSSQFFMYILLSCIIFIGLTYIIVMMQKKNKAIREANQNIEKTSELIRLRNKEIIDSISYAKKIQEAILTPEYYLNNIFNDYFIYYHPKDIVSGDFYWAYKDTASNKVFWVTADCTGHGVPGALMSVIGTVILNEIVIVGKQHQPSLILSSLSKYLKKYLNKNKNDISQDGIELSLCVLNHDAKTLEFSGANSNLIIIRDKEIIELKGGKQPIGFDPFKRESKEFMTQTFPYKTGDCIYSFTDGYTDQIGGPNRRKYKVGVLKQKLQEINEFSLINQKEIIHQNFTDWKKEYDQLDDVLMICVKV